MLCAPPYIGLGRRRRRGGDGEEGKGRGRGRGEGRGRGKEGREFRASCEFGVGFQPPITRKR